MSNLVETKMKQVHLSAFSATLLLAFSSGVLAQAPTLASTMEVYVFPSKGQDTAQQSKDESECYAWAESNTGTDPFALGEEAQANEQQAQAEQQAAKQVGQSAGAQGAVRGAAAGALNGEIANDDASNGAAWGAAAGVVRGRRKGAEAQQQAQQQTKSSSEQRTAATEEQLANFKKAFSVCLEAKEYMVKY